MGKHLNRFVSEFKRHALFSENDLDCKVTRLCAEVRTLRSWTPLFATPTCVGDIRQICKLQDENGVLSRVESSEFDADGDDAAQSFSTCLSPHPEIGAHDCRLGWERRDPIRTSGGDAAISSEIDDGGIVGHRYGYSTFV